MNKMMCKSIATTFYRWWHNQPGTNIDQGFDQWWDEYGSDLQYIDPIQMAKDEVEWEQYREAVDAKKEELRAAKWWHRLVPFTIEVKMRKRS